MDFDVSTLVAAIEEGETLRAAGGAILAVVALARTYLEPRLGKNAQEWLSAAAGILAAFGVLLLARAPLWQAALLSLLGLTASRGFWRKVASLVPQGWGGALLLLLALGLGSHACTVEVGPEDRGLMLREGTGGELVELHAAAYPVAVSADPELADEVQDAIDWWGDQAQGEPWAEWTDGVGTVHVFVGSVAPDYGGICDLTYDRWSGEIIEAAILIEPGWSGPEHLRHELGHAALGLDDDGPSVELRSIMSSPVLPDATLTAADRAAVERWRS